MLKKNHLRYRVVKNKVIPFFLTLNKHQFILKTLLDIFKNHIGKPFSELDEQLKIYTDENLSNRKVLLGLIHIIQKKTIFNESDESIQEFRKTSFEFSDSLLNKFSNLDYETFLYEVDEYKNNRSLYADLKSNKIILQVPNWSEEQLLQRYNLALSQTLILNAETLHLKLEKPSEKEWHYLQRYLSFLGLCYEVLKNENNAVLIDISGPIELVNSSSFYQNKKALFIGSLPQLLRFELQTNLKINNKKCFFNLSEKSQLKSHYIPFYDYIHEDLQAFMNQVKTLIQKSEERIIPCQPIKESLHLKLIPTLSWETKSTQQFHLKIVTKEQSKLFHKLNEFMNSELYSKTIFCVHDSLKNEKFTQEKFMFFYRSIPSFKSFNRLYKQLKCQ